MAATLKLVRTGAEDSLAGAFDAMLALEATKADARLPLGSAQVIEARREQMAAFLRDGLPNRRIEAWKYTDLRALLTQVPPVAPAVSQAQHDAAAKMLASLPLAALPPLLTVDGAFLPSAAIPDGIEWSRLSEMLYDPKVDIGFLFANPVLPSDDQLVRLNRAFFHDGALLRVSAGTTVATPVHVAFVSPGASERMVTNRLIVEVGAGATVTVIESHCAGDGVSSLFNSLVEFRLGDGATVEHVRLDMPGSDARSFSTLAVSLGSQATFRARSIAGGALSRQQVFARFLGEGATLDVGGATLLRGHERHDVTLVVDHIAPHGVSRELYRTVLDDEAIGTFQGRINVAKDAQKTDGRMASNALMLSDSARMNNKPELEIFADDVQCAHGATCGALDEELLFYFMARGIPRKVAEALMIESFAGEALEAIENETVREAMMDRIRHWLSLRT